MWLAAGLAAVLGGLVVVVAALAERDTTAVPSRVGPVTPHDLRTVRFPIVWRGYDPGHVDAVLARAAVALEDARHYGAPAEGGALPGFIAETFEDDEQDDAGGGDPDGPVWSAPAESGPSGQELEDGGGDGTGRLDR